MTESYMSIFKAVIWMAIADEAMMTQEDSWTNCASIVVTNVRWHFIIILLRYLPIALSYYRVNLTLATANAIVK